jgi:hypothetical protein
MTLVSQQNHSNSESRDPGTLDNRDSAKTKKLQTNKTNHMNDTAFADLKQVLEDALAFERCERRKLKVTRIEGSRPAKASVKIQQSEKR